MNICGILPPKPILFPIPPSQNACTWNRHFNNSVWCTCTLLRVVTDTPTFHRWGDGVLSEKKPSSLLMFYYLIGFLYLTLIVLLHKPSFPHNRLLNNIPINFRHHRVISILKIIIIKKTDCSSIMHFPLSFWMLAKIFFFHCCWWIESKTHSKVTGTKITSSEWLEIGKHSWGSESISSNATCCHTRFSDSGMTSGFPALQMLEICRVILWK